MTAELPVFRHKHEPSTNTPKEWLRFIKSAKRESNDYKTLLRLYHRAANLITPEEYEKDPAYAQLLVEFAQLQSKTSIEDARDTYRVARCNVKRFAVVYIAWAQLELTHGNKHKCRKLLQKGKQNNAQPDDLLQIAVTNFEQGRERLLDEETEELALTGIQILPNTNLQPLAAMNSDNETVEKKDDNTESGVVSFKMPSISEGFVGIRHRNRQSTSSSSGEETVTAPFHNICKTTARKQTMSHHKPMVKPTPDTNKNVGSSSITNSMNLSVRKPTARRGLGWRNTGFLGLPMRAPSTLDEVKERPTTDDEEMDFKPIEPTVDIGQLNKKESTPQEKLKFNELEKIQDPGMHELKVLQIQNKPAVTAETLPQGVAKHLEFESNKENIGKEPFSLNNRKLELDNRSLKNSGAFSRPSGNPDISKMEPLLAKEVQNGNLKVICDQVQTIQPTAVPCVNSVQPTAVPPVVPCVNSVVPPPVFLNNNQTIVVNGKAYQKLEKIGRGGSSQVFRAFDGKRVCAVKQVSLEDADEVIVQSYINEITLLNQLQGCDHIIKLYNWELNKEDKSISLVLECGSIDLSAFLRKNRGSLNPTHLSVYWEQMLRAVNVVHEKGIVHSDLKPANFLFVDGQLKLIDFGIANAIQGDQTSIQRDTQIGTLNFMAPEAFLDVSGSHQMEQRAGGKPCMKIGRASDVWSLGCILYNMVYGRTPFQHITNQAMKLQCIMDPSFAIEFPAIKNNHLLNVMKGCLIRNPRERYTIQQLLHHPFLTAGVQTPPDQEQMFRCLMEFARADVNSPRSVRAVSERLCEQLRRGNKIDMSSVLPRPNP